MSPPAQLKTSTSSNATVRVRTAWFLVSSCVEDGAQELHLAWKYADNSVGFYKGGQKKPPWGKVISCTFKNITDEHGKSWGHISFSNGRGKRVFKLAEFNPTLWSINSFTTKILEMRTAGKDELLTSYLSMMLRAKSFSQHKADVHDEDGLSVDSPEASIQEMEEKEGSLAEYKDFVLKAKESCLNVKNSREIMEKVDGGKRKRKNQDLQTPAIKKSKIEKVEEAKDFEVNRKEGLEKNHVDKYIGRAEVELKNLVCSKKVQLSINSFKVEGLVRSISTRPDPALLSLTVCRVDGSPYDSEDLGNNHFEVIHGRHRYVYIIQTLY